jgi:hypothetical protein
MFGRFVFSTEIVVLPDYLPCFSWPFSYWNCLQPPSIKRTGNSVAIYHVVEHNIDLARDLIRRAVRSGNE